MSKDNDIRSLAELAWQERRLGAEVNLERIQQLQSYAEATGTPQYAAIAGLLKALSSFYLSKYDEALTEGQQAAAAIAKDCLAPWPARSLYILGLLLSAKNALAEALQQWKLGLELAKSTQDQEIEGFCLYNLADMNRAIFRRYDLAKQYYKAGLKLCHGEVKHLLCGPLLMGLSRSELAEGDIQTSLVHAERALALAIESGDERSIGLCYEFAGSRYRDIGQFDKAKVYLQSCLENRRKRNDHYGLVNAYCALSVLESHLDNPQAAKELIDQAFEIYNTLDTHVLDDILYEQRAKVCEALMDWEGAARGYRLYASARNRSITKELEDLMTVLASEFQLESAKKDAEIQRLKSVELQAKNLEITQLAAELEQALEDLKETQGELVRTSRLNGLLNVITGIAHEINTPLGNSITWSSFIESLSFEIQNSCPELSMQMRLELQEAVQHLSSNLSRVSRIVESLKKLAISPESLSYQTNDLKATLEEWLQDASIKHPGIAISPRWSSEAAFICRFEKSSLWSILDELVENTSRHAYPASTMGKVEIQLTHSGNSVQLSLVDFGCGMPLEKHHSLFEPFKTLRAPSSGLGLGLHLVYLLTVNVLLGHVEIHSSTAKGTTAILTLPVGVQSQARGLT